MLKKAIIILVLAGFALAACAAQQAMAPEPLVQVQTGVGGADAAMPPVEYAAEMEGYRSATDSAGPGLVPQPANAPGQAQAPDRLVIKNVSLSLVVKDPSASAESIAQLAGSLGGFVVTSNVYQASVDAAGNKIMQANVAIRVPAERLDEALAQIKRLSVTGQAESENISGEDVTAQYTDLESQLRNLEAAERQLQAIMEGATRTQDVLEVYNQLVSVRGQIEQVKGQMQYYQEAAAMSYISISLIPDALSQPLEVGGWKAEGVAKEALEALVRAFQGIATGAIWLAIYILPLGLLFGLPLAIGARLALRRMRKPRPVVQA